MSSGESEGNGDPEKNTPGSPALDDSLEMRDSPRRLPGLGTALAIAIPLLITLGLMASDRHFGFSVPLGGASVLTASLALIHAFGGFAPSNPMPAAESRPFPWSRAVMLFVALVSLVLALRAAVSGVLPMPVITSAVSVPACFVWVTIAAYRMLQGLGWFHDGRPLTQRYGFWLILIHALIYLPLLGSFSLIDPWETHYGEVAREMLARDDWISLWWAQDGFFFSKPILDFWLQGLSFSLLGVEYLPGRMLASVTDGAIPHPEWAARVPVFFLTVAASYVSYRAVSRVYSARIGFLSAVILASVPYWYLIGHQSMTDMPYVAPLVACLSFFLLGLAHDPERPLDGRVVNLLGKRLELGGHQLLLVTVLCCALPQILYLITRNATLGIDSGVLTLHPDLFFSGSGGGNCGVFPGNEACREMRPVNPFVQPALLAALWTILLMTLLGLYKRERRTRQIYYMAAWLCLALSAMGKGAPGIVIPIFVILVFLGATYRWREYVRLNPVALLLIFSCLALPWYVQMVMRHGSPFSDRLLIHDMYKRAFDHVHDTNAGVDTSFRYYLWQLGYGLFPWSGLAGVGLLHWLGKTRDEGTTTLSQQQASSFFGLWFIAAFGVFAISGTKYHHYVLPAVPPLGVLTAVLVDALLDGRRKPKKALAYLVAMACSSFLALTGLITSLGASLLGTAASDSAMHSTLRHVIAGSCLVLSAYACAVATRFAGPRTSPAYVQNGSTSDNALYGLYGLAASTATLLVGLDLVRSPKRELPGQLHWMQLFTYKYERPWPENLDFRALFLAFTLFFVVVLAALAFRSLRAHAAIAVTVGSLLLCSWGINVYLFRLAPHWGQRGNVIAYLEARKSADPPLVAFQMNWKGENFYTGNRLVTFVKSGDPFSAWVKKQRARKIRTLYITTEHSRVDRLKRELGKFKHFTLLTTEKQNNKFMVARVDL